MAGLLDQLFGSPDQTQALGLLGAGLMAGNPAAGFASANGLLADAPRRRLHDQLAQLQVQSGQMTLDEMRRKLQDEAAARQVLQGFYAGHGMPGASQVTAPASPITPDMGMGGSPSIPQTSGFPQSGAQFPQGPAPQAIGGVMPKAEVWKQYNALGDQLAAKGLVDKAQLYYGLAEKMRPKYSTTPQQMMVGGKLTNVLIGEDGTAKTLDGFDVKPDMVEQDLGGKKMWVNKNALTPGQEFSKTMSPGEVASNQLGWANNSATLRGQNLTDARTRERLDFERGNLVADSGGPSQAAYVKQFGKPTAGYRWKADGSQEAIPGGPADLKAQATTAGQSTVDGVVAELRDKYRQLQEGGGITSTANGALGNTSAWLSSSAGGQAAGRMLGTQNQSQRNSISMSRPLLLQAIMKATGMSAKQMDSNAELKLYLSTATDPTLDLEANMAALDRIEKLYGSGNKGKPTDPNAPPDKSRLMGSEGGATGGWGIKRVN